MKNTDYEKLFQRFGDYSLNFLIQLRHPERQTWFFCNSQDDIIFDNSEYIAVPMSYTPPSSNNGVYTGGTLEIDIEAEYERGLLLQWFDTVDDRASLLVRAVIDQNGDVSEIGTLLHRHGTVTWDGEKITWNLGEDDRLQMQINPVAFDSDALID